VNNVQQGRLLFYQPLILAASTHAYAIARSDDAIRLVANARNAEGHLVGKRDNYPSSQSYTLTEVYQRTDIPDLFVNILAAIFIEANSWNSNFAA
jgi:hypothetical protein